MTEKKWLCYDIETKNFMKKNRCLGSMELSMVGWYCSWDKRIQTVQEEDLHLFFNDVREAHLIVGFNTKGFDNIIMKRYDHNNVLGTSNHFDMMEECVAVLGHRVSLDSIAKASLDRKKMAHSSIAPILWQQGRFQELTQYLIRDIEITRDIFIKGCNDNQLTFQSKVAPYSVLPIDTVHWFETAQLLIQIGMGS